MFSISNLRRVLNAVFFLLDDSPVSEFYVPTFRNTRSIHWVDGARYLGVTLDTQLIWSTHIDQVRQKVVQRLRVLRPLLKMTSGLYQEWSSAVHIRKLQVFQYKCLRIVTSALWHTGNKQIHEDLGVLSLPTTSDL
jgi:hypothetical protein